MDEKLVDMCRAAVDAYHNTLKKAAGLTYHEGNMMTQGADEIFLAVVMASGLTYKDAVALKDSIMVKFACSDD